MKRKKTLIIEEQGCLVRMVHQDRVEKARAEALENKEMEALSRCKYGRVKTAR